MIFEEVVVVSLLISIFIFLVLKVNLKYYGEESKEKRKKMKNAQFDPTIHKLCEECHGTGQDLSWGTCFDCEAKGFVEKSNQEIYKDNFY